MVEGAGAGSPGECCVPRKSIEFIGDREEIDDVVTKSHEKKGIFFRSPAVFRSRNCTLKSIKYLYGKKPVLA